MPDNPYTRTVNVEVTELVPERTMLPQCHGWKVNGFQCKSLARYEMNGRPVCAMHCSPKAMLVPEKWVKSE